MIFPTQIDKKGYRIPKTEINIGEIIRYVSEEKRV
jgi:hypothetical protein